jgi:predicted PurR-regulated permease PerM
MNGDKFLKLGLGIIVVFLLGIFLKLARPVLVPFALALLLSFAVSPILRFLTRLKIPRAVALTVILLVTFVLLYLLGVLFYSSGKSFAAELPSYREMVQEFVSGIERLVPNEQLREALIGWTEKFDIEAVGSFLLSALGPFFSFMSGLLLVFFFMIFILSGKGRLEGKIVRAFPANQAATLARTIRRIDHEIQKYLAIKTLINLGIGLLTGAVLTLFGLPFSIVFGFLAFVANYMPTIGAAFAVLPPVLMAAFYYPTYGPVFWIFVILAVIHLGLGGQLEPRLMGKGLSLSPLLVLVSLFLGGWLWGIPGMVLVVPILAVLKIVFSNIPSLAFLEAMMDK